MTISIVHKYVVVIIAVVVIPVTVFCKAPVVSAVYTRFWYFFIFPGLRFIANVDRMKKLRICLKWYQFQMNKNFDDSNMNVCTTGNNFKFLDTNDI